MPRDKKIRLRLTGALILLFASCAAITGYASPGVTNPQVGKIKYVPGEILVKFRSGVPQAVIQAFNRTHRTQVLQKLPRLKAMRLKLPSGMDVSRAAEVYGRNPDIEYAEPNYIYHPYASPNDSMYSEQWALEKINMESVWDLEKGNTGVVIAIVDTGVQWDHPDLSGKIWDNSDEIAGNGTDDDNNGYIDDVRGWDTADADNNPADSYGHGTHCAGIAAAQTDNSIGISGVAWNCRIMPVKIDSMVWERAFTAAACAEAITYAADNGAQVISMSWGGPADSSAIRSALEQAHSQGVVLIAAAGNSNDDFSGYPAVYHNVISVSATNCNDNKVYFSTYGVFVDVAAPGADIYSTYTGSSYASFSGTSMAAPHAAGLAALLISHNSALNNEQIRQILHNSSDDKGDPGWDVYYGYGRINASQALQQAGSSQPPLTAWIASPGTHDMVKGVIELRGKAFGSGFSSFEISIGRGLAPGSWETSGISLAGGEVGDGVLGQWDTTQVENGQYLIRLRVFDTTGGVYEDRISVIVEQDGKAIKTSSMLFSSPLVSDLDGNGTMEIVQISTDWDEQLLNIYKHDGSQLNSNWPKQDSNFWYGWYGVLPAAADIDQDGESEILTLGYGGTSLCAWKLDGDFLPGFPLGFSSDMKVWGSPSIGDINKDGCLEIAFICRNTSSYTYWLYVVNNQGHLLSGWPQELKGSITYTDTAPALGDITNDGFLEMVVTTAGGEVFAYKYDGSLVPGWPQAMADTDYSQAALGDVDGDGKLEVIAVCPGRYYLKTMVYAWRGDGSLMPGWPQRVGGRPTFPALGNLDGMGGLEIVVGSADHRVYAWHYDGSLVPGWPQEIGDGMSYASSPVIGDIDGDGSMEVIVSGNRDNKIYAWHSDGSSVEGWPKETGSYNITSPALGDVDNDGRMDVIAASADGRLYIWHCPGRYSPEAVAWAMRAHDEKNTSCAAYHYLPAGELLSRTRVFNYPNPAKGKNTTFRYYVNQDAVVTIRIYNLAGELVAQLKDKGIGGRQDNEIVWNMGNVASGVYIYQLRAQAPGETSFITKKLAIVR